MVFYPFNVFLTQMVFYPFNVQSRNLVAPGLYDVHTGSPKYTKDSSFDLVEMHFNYKVNSFSVASKSDFHL